MLFDQSISGARRQHAEEQPTPEAIRLAARQHDRRDRRAICLEPAQASELLKTSAPEFPGASLVEPSLKATRSATVSAQDDRLFIQQLQAGDRQAFAELLDRYEARVYRLALRFTGAASDAEDVTQEIFLGIYKSIGQFRGGAALSTWIYRVAMNHCLEFRRKRKLDSVPYNEELALASCDWREDPEQAARKTELSARVEAALQHLSPQHRDVVVLHELQGLTYQEVASTLNVPVGTVKSRLSNAFRRLRDLLGGYVHEE